MLSFFGLLSDIGTNLLFRGLAVPITAFLVQLNPQLSTWQRSRLEESVARILLLVSRGSTLEAVLLLRSLIFAVAPGRPTSSVLDEMLRSFPLLGLRLSSSMSEMGPAPPPPPAGSRSTFEEPVRPTCEGLRSSTAGADSSFDAEFQEVFGVRDTAVFSLPMEDRHAVLVGLRSADGSLCCPISLDPIFLPNSRRLAPDVVAIVEHQSVERGMADYGSVGSFVFFYKGQSLRDWFQQGGSTNPVTRQPVRPSQWIRLTAS